MLLDHDARAIALPEPAADAFDLAKLVRLLERAVGVSVFDDLLGHAAADTLQLHQLLDVRGVDVDESAGRRRRLRLSGSRRRRRDGRPRSEPRERDEQDEDPDGTVTHEVPP